MLAPLSRSVAVALVTLAIPALAHAAPAPKISYNRDVRPILSDNCFYCHGFDKNHRDGKLRLDIGEEAIAKKAFIPGKPDESELVKRIFQKDPDELMPPPKTHKKLTDAQKSVLKQWIAEGAVYEPHWAYIAPKRWPVPAVKNAAWVRNPIDAFILANLESKNFTPSKEADRRTLLRRLSLDLIGLPPTPAEVDAFVNDKSPDAYEKQVDRLLASPRYGERMAVPWLDAVRFADTVGFHGDQNQNVFPYRDYVINAFNANKPFDQFLTEQLAGDLMPKPTTEQLTATGFNRLNMMTREGGAQPKEYLAKYVADRVRTVSNAMLGSTFGCAECHDHKFDPISTKDFYSLGAFFADVKQWGVYTSYVYTPNPDLAGFTNDSPFPPEIVVDSPYLLNREKQLITQIDVLAAAAGVKLAQDPKKKQAYDAWRRDVATFVKANPTGWLTLATLGEEPASSNIKGGEDPTEKPAPAQAEPKKPARGKKPAKGVAKPVADVAPAQPKLAAKATAPVMPVARTDMPGAFEFVSKPGSDDRLVLKLPAGPIAAIRLEAIPAKGGAAIGNLTRDEKGGAANVVLAAVLETPDGKKQPLSFYHAEADHKTERYSNGYAILGLNNGWRTDAKLAKSPQTATYLLDAPATAAEGDMLVVRIDKNMLASVRVSISPVTPMTPTRPLFDDTLRTGLANAASNEPTAWRAYLSSTAADPATLKQLRAIQNEVFECRDGKSPTLVTQAWEPVVSRIRPRGNWQDDSGEIVEPNTPHFLPGPKAEPGKRLNRLDLAKWITSADNPLTARVYVNRLWKQLFGAGLYNSPEDIGAQGEMPVHPELLDWLSVEFRESKWDVKHVLKLMVMSNAYRQDSNLRKDLLDADPQNRLITSQSPRRLEAEFVRDNALLAAGLLNTADIGGPSVMPYQPGGYYEAIQFPSRDWKNETDDRQYRRGLYMHWQRTFLHPMLANFDAPSREDAICTRNVSNTPQQALTLLNDPEYVEAARVLATHAMASGNTDDQRLEFIFQRALSRLPKTNERESLTTFLSTQRDYFKNASDDAAKLLHIGIAPLPVGVDEKELAAWTSVARVVLNLHETITRY